MYKRNARGVLHPTPSKKNKEVIQSLKIPPSYKNVEIDLRKREGYIATGKDSTGRTQYFYDKKHLEKSYNKKYEKLIRFGEKLPTLCKRIDAYLKTPFQQWTDDHKCALALKIMITCNFRVGNDEYAEEYNTFGISTLNKKHFSFNRDGTVKIEFIGKKKMKNEKVLQDKKLSKMLKHLVEQARGGNDVFGVDSGKINDFLNDCVGNDSDERFTTKMWRTWVANIMYINDVPKPAETETERKKDSVEAIKKSAEALFHTPSIHKKNYLMNELPEMYITQPEKWIRTFHGDTRMCFLKFLKKEIGKN